jgi:DNA-binding winged helix-turn-helix (wHTH) protein
VLAALAQRPGEVVTREELGQSLWPNDIHVDSDRGLYQSVQKLPAVFGDTTEAPRFIETIPPRGYPVVAPVRAGLAVIQVRSASFGFGRPCLREYLAGSWPREPLD